MGALAVIILPWIAFVAGAIASNHTRPLVLNPTEANVLSPYPKLKPSGMPVWFALSPVAVEEVAPPPKVIGMYAELNVVRVKRVCAIALLIMLAITINVAANIRKRICGLLILVLCVIIDLIFC